MDASDTIVRRGTPQSSSPSRRPASRLRPPAVQLRPKRSTTYLGALRATTMMNTKIALPAEILDIVLDYLTVSDLLRCARASRRMQEMVYDDTRWVRKLQLMGCWNERQARQRIEESMLRKLETNNETKSLRRVDSVAHGRGQSWQQDRTLFDAGWETQTAMHPISKGNIRSETITDVETQMTSSDHQMRQALTALDFVQSIRGGARKEYGKVHKILQPFYADIVKAPNLKGSQVYSSFADVQEHARLLAQLRRFSAADTTSGCAQRHQHLLNIFEKFEDAALREYEISCRNKDFDGNMHRYAHVLASLDGGAAAVNLFIAESRLFKAKDELGRPDECLEGCAPGHTDLNPSRIFFIRLASGLDDEVLLIQRVFPSHVDVFTPLLEQVQQSIISEYMNTLFEEARNLSAESYVKAVAGILNQLITFVQSINPPGALAEGFKDRAFDLVEQMFQSHFTLFLQENMELFLGRCRSEVEYWKKQLSEKEASEEQFYMSHVSRHVAKQDFLTSFKKVFMMPVATFPTASRSSKSVPSTGTGSASSNAEATPGKDSPVPADRDAPMTELAAQTAIIKSKLEGIGALLSLDIALTLVHAAKAALERVATFMLLRESYRSTARDQCQTIFVDLLRILSTEHVEPGFQKAITALSKYDARGATDHSGSGVRPLVMFLELVHVGDLIQQMIDVFFTQELVTPKIVDRDDFLNQANKSKKKFEQSLDENVAAGLSKGIDVLMDEVEYVCATTQAPTDFNPGNHQLSNHRDSHLVMDIGPTKTSQQIVELVSTHTDMLQGSTDKNMLDVFNQEVGLRLFTALCKHIKRQRISCEGAIKLISDTNLYFQYVQSLRNKELLQYFKALRELSQIFLVEGSHAKEIATIIADGDRYHGIFRAEEVYEFAQRRADWYMVKGGVEKAMYGVGCTLM